jgi:hypothetical protein
MIIPTFIRLLVVRQRLIPRSILGLEGGESQELSNQGYNYDQYLAIIYCLKSDTLRRVDMGTNS